MSELEKSMINLHMVTSMEEKRPGEFTSAHYRNVRQEAENARAPLMELGMYEPVKAAIDTAEDLLKQRRFKEASEILYKTYRELMGKSGTDERNARRYGKQGPVAQGAAFVSTGDGVEEWGVLGADEYGGAFSRAASAAERGRVSEVESGLALLRHEVFVEEMQRSQDGGGGLAERFRKVRDAIVRAEPQLAKLGVCRMLLGVLLHAESLIGEGEHAEAEQLLGVAQEALSVRAGLKVGRGLH